MFEKKVKIEINGNKVFMEKIVNAINLLGIKNKLTAYRKDELKWVLEAQAGLGVIKKMVEMEIEVPAMKIGLLEDGGINITEV